MGLSNKFDPEVQLDQVALYWLNVCEAEPAPLTIRVLGKDRDVRLEIAGGSRIPKYSERGPETAQILAELRASWHGVEKLLLAYDGSPLSVDFLDTVLSFLDPAIGVTLIDVAEPRPGSPAAASAEAEAREIIERGVERARELGRAVDFLVAQGDPGPQIVRAAQEGKFDAIFLSLRGDYRARDTVTTAPTTRYVLEHAPCRVILGFAPKTIAQSSGVTAPLAQESTL
jgi:nucleotide-binding universal stress UspA family protein